MRPFLFVFISLLTSCMARTQTGSGERVYLCFFETGGKPDPQWRSYLEHNLYPEESALDSIPDGVYKAAVTFELDTTGKIINVRIDYDPGFGLGKRLRDIIASYPRRWTPAIYNERLVKTYRKQQATFIIEKPEAPPSLDCGGSYVTL